MAELKNLFHAHTNTAMLKVYDERKRQEELKQSGKFTFTCADSDIPYGECLAVLAEEFGEVSREVTEHIITTRKYAADPKLAVAPNPNVSPQPATMPPHREEYFRQHLLKELVQVAAVAVAWCERLERDSALYRSRTATCGTTSSEQSIPHDPAIPMP